MHFLTFPVSFKKIQLFPRQRNSGLDHTESITIQQVKSDSNITIFVGKSGKHCGERRKCWLPAFSPFPKMFSKVVYLRVVKSWHCMVKS